MTQVLKCYVIFLHHWNQDEQMNLLILFSTSNSKIIYSSRANCKICQLYRRTYRRTGILEYTAVCNYKPSIFVTKEDFGEEPPGKNCYESLEEIPEDDDLRLDPDGHEAVHLGDLPRHVSPVPTLRLNVP